LMAKEVKRNPRQVSPESRRYGQRAGLSKPAFDALVKEYGSAAAKKALAYWNSQPAGFRAGIVKRPTFRGLDCLPVRLVRRP